MQIQKGDLQVMFNTFLQCSQQKPQQSKKFAQFGYMENSLKKSFKLLKKIDKVKISDQFHDFWKQLTTQQQINYYIKSVKLLGFAVKHLKPSLPTEKQSQIYIKKGVIGKWQKRNVRLTPKSFFIRGNKQIKSYDLYKYALRKSKNKQYFGWVLQAIQKSSLASLHCGVTNVKQFQDWFHQFDININYIKVDRYSKILENKGDQYLKNQNTNNKTQYLQTAQENIKFNESIASNMFIVKKQDNEQFEQNTNLNQLYSNNKTESFSSSQKRNDQDKSDMVSISSQEQVKTYRQNKTITEIVMKNQMTDAEQMLQIKPLRDSKQAQKQSPLPFGQRQNLKPIYKPNIFKRLMPEYNINNFIQFPSNAIMIHSDSDYRMVQMPSNDQSTIRIKMSIILPFPKTLVFKAIAQQPQAWSTYIQIFNIKNAIKSENTAVMYQKHKAQGLLYRQRDYLFLRHCFCIHQSHKLPKQARRQSSQLIHKTFIIDKSIDSVHNPPFMTVARGQKQLIWCLVKGQTDKQCQLVVQGTIKGGGYMNKSQNKDMTIKYFKQILKMTHYLKQKTFAKDQKSQVLSGFFKENWLVTFNQQQEQKIEVRVKKMKKVKEGPSYHQQQKNPVQLQQQRIKKQQQLEQFMQQKQEEHIYSQQRRQLSANLSSDLLQQGYRHPPFNIDESIKIPQKYLKVKHKLVPYQKSQKPNYFPPYRGHHIWKGQWEINNNGGGINYIDQQKMQEQKKVLTYIIKRIGKNILSGKGILNVSLPVDIFCVQSNIQRLAMSFGYFPDQMEQAVKLNNDQQQMKHVISAGLPSSLIYLTMEKPFNPILGQTYQCWMDGCPIYFQQVSHHPPAACFLFKGRGYQISGGVQAKMDLSINSGTGYNQGIFTIKFDNGNQFYFITPKGQLQGLTYGQRKLNMVGKTYFWSNTGLFCELIYNPFAQKKGFFGGGGGNYTGQQKFTDYFEGQMKRYDTKLFKQFLTPKKNDSRQVMLIPKGPPPFDPIKQVYKVCGRCFNHIKIDGKIVFDVDKTQYYGITDEKNPLPSHANFRQDVVYRRLKQFVKSQEWKQKLQILQRKDRKGRQDYLKKKKKK